MSGLRATSGISQRARSTAFAFLISLSLALGACSEAGPERPSDPQIRQEAVAILEARNITGISVDVQDGVVTLGGEAADEATAASAVEAVRLVEGVRQVDSQIAVAPPATPIDPGNRDSLTQARLETALLASRDLAGAKVTADVAGGVATLTGTVPSDAAKAAAERVASSLEGVASVNNQLQVVAGPAVVSVPDDQVKTDVETLLDTSFPDLLLTVDVKAGQVTLKGAVNTRNQIVDIARRVRQVKGVQNVDTHLLTILGGEGDQRIGSPAGKTP